MRWRAPDHAFCFSAYGYGPSVFDVDGDYRWLIKNDAFAANVNKGVGGAEIDSHVAPDNVGQRVS